MFQTTGGWQIWQTISRRESPLSAGPHVLRVVIDTNGSTGWWGNLNYSAGLLHRRRRTNP